MSDEPEIRLATRSDEFQAVALVEKHMGLPRFDVPFWDWRYHRHPAGAGVVVVACHAEEVVGVVGAFPCPLRGQEGEVTFWFQADLVVVPGWRRRGLFAGMERRLLDELARAGAPATFCAASDMSYRGYRQLGFSPLATVQDRVLLSGRPVGKAEQGGGRRLIRRGLAALARLWPRGHLRRALARFDLRPTEDWSEVGEMARRCAGAGWGAAASGPLWGWRFGEHPWHRYQAVVLEQAGEALGCLVVRGQNLLRLDCVPDRAAQQALLAAAWQYALEESLPDLHCYLWAEGEVTREYARAGFLAHPRTAARWGCYPPQRLIVKAIDESAADWCYRPDSWRLQMAEIAYGL